MPKYAVAKQTGEILQVITGGFRYIEVPEEEDVHDTTHYIDISNDEIKAKQKIMIRSKINGLSLTMSGLPSGLNVETNGMAIITDDEPLVIEYDVPGIYQVALSGRVDYLDEVLEVTVDHS
ncbi:hypothetical protein ACT3R4_18060 [Halomonas sp. AOP7-E1-9]|uniref:hypothetical protein n=1 Tax=Halomonas sp. AOP22-C1-8 TaxID=3457717 RepID=UPI0040334901